MSQQREELITYHSIQWPYVHSLGRTHVCCVCATFAPLCSGRQSKREPSYLISVIAMYSDNPTPPPRCVSKRPCALNTLATLVQGHQM